MRPEPNIRIEQYRRVHPTMGGSEGNFGYFVHGPLRIISSGTCDGNPESHGWEHVSVSCVNRCPTWEEMAVVKSLFWGDNETVLQFHPRADKHINHHPYCLHLWKRDGEDHELPPALLIGPQQ